MSGLRYLTRGDLANMTPAMIQRRQANWAGIIRGLQLEHERRYHGPKRIAEAVADAAHRRTA